ncbi:MAG: aldo/keto reductase, partial [Thermoproteus sp.]
ARRTDPAIKKANTEEGRRVVETVNEVARRTGVSPARVVLSWLKRRGVLPIPGVKNTAQAEDVAGSIGFELPEDYYKLLDETSAPFIRGQVGMNRIRYVPGFLQKALLRLYPL